MCAHTCSFWLATLAVLILLYLYCKTDTPAVKTPARQINSFHDLTDGEKMDYVVRAYFQDSQAATPNSESIVRENKYLESLPEGADCPDMFGDCPIWAQNGECTANPEFMVYNCKKSCKSCAMNPEQLYNYTKIHNSREPENCVYHGESYPDPVLFSIEKYDEYF